MDALQTNDAVRGDTYTVLKFRDVKALICQAVRGQAALPAAVFANLNVANAVSIRTEHTENVSDTPFSKFSIMSGKPFFGEFGSKFSISYNFG